MQMSEERTDSTEIAPDVVPVIDSQKVEAAADSDDRTEAPVVGGLRESGGEGTETSTGKPQGDQLFVGDKKLDGGQRSAGTEQSAVDANVIVPPIGELSTDRAPSSGEPATEKSADIEAVAEVADDPAAGGDTVEGLAGQPVEGPSEEGKEGASETVMGSKNDIPMYVEDTEGSRGDEDDEDEGDEDDEDGGSEGEQGDEDEDGKKKKLKGSKGRRKSGAERRRLQNIKRAAAMGLPYPPPSRRSGSQVDQASNNNNHQSRFSHGPHRSGGSYQPERDPNDPTYVYLRLLVTAKDAQEIVGKKGASIHSINDNCPGVRINVSDYVANVPERVVSIRGKQEHVAKACGLIVRVLRGEPFDQPSTPEAVPYNMRLLFPQAVIGGLIGKAGSKIKEVEQKSAAKLQAHDSNLPNSQDRVLSINGVADAVHLAVYYTIGNYFTASKNLHIPNYVPYDPVRAFRFAGPSLGPGGQGAAWGSQGGGYGTGGYGQGPAPYGHGAGYGYSGRNRYGAGGAVSGQGGYGTGVQPPTGPRASGHSGSMGQRGGPVGGMMPGMVPPPGPAGAGYGGYQSRGYGGGPGEYGYVGPTGPAVDAYGRRGPSYDGGGHYNNNGAGGYNSGSAVGGYGGNAGYYGWPASNHNALGPGRAPVPAPSVVGNQHLYQAQLEASRQPQNVPFTQTIYVPDDFVGSIIGKGGSRITEIRTTSNAEVRIKDSLPGTSDRPIEISGLPENNRLAIYLIHQRVETDKARGGGR